MSGILHHANPNNIELIYRDGQYLGYWADGRIVTRDEMTNVINAWQASLESIDSKATGAWNRMISDINSDEYDDYIEGFIYVLRAQNGLYKIGQTIDLTRRLNEHRRLWSGNGWDWQLVNAILVKAPADVEIHLHNKFRTKRRKTGDWFELDKSDLDYIEGLRNNAYD